MFENSFKMQTTKAVQKTYYNKKYKRNEKRKNNGLHQNQALKVLHE